VPGSALPDHPVHRVTVLVPQRAVVVIYLVWMWISAAALFGAGFSTGLERGCAVATSQANSKPLPGCGNGETAQERGNAIHSRYQPWASRWTPTVAVWVHRERVRRMGSA
jgi:hypothetical protein